MKHVGKMRVGELRCRQSENKLIHTFGCETNIFCCKKMQNIEPFSSTQLHGKNNNTLLVFLWLKQLVHNNVVHINVQLGELLYQSLRLIEGEELCNTHTNEGRLVLYWENTMSVS